jgi:hypothetical protein
MIRVIPARCLIADAAGRSRARASPAGLQRLPAKSVAGCTAVHRDRARPAVIRMAQTWALYVRSHRGTPTPARTTTAIAHVGRRNEVIAQESESTPQWRTRKALFSRFLTTILRITIAKIGFVLDLTSTGTRFRGDFSAALAAFDAGVVPHPAAKVISAWRADAWPRPTTGPPPFSSMYWMAAPERRPCVPPKSKRVRGATASSAIPL